MQWIVELLEIFSGYLSNTLSFMRVAGLGIAHVSLMIAFFTIADMTSGIMSVIVLILGNMLVIGLEGLSAAIQALRLIITILHEIFHGTGNIHAFT
jgi:V/A-type H+-transporting ATPase subunit I